MTSTVNGNANLPAPVEVGLKALIPGIVRTLVPIVVALVVRFGLGDLMDNVTVEYILTTVVTMAYYIVIRLLERYWSQIGWLLGYAKQPVYVKGEVVSVTTTQPNVTGTSTTEVKTDEG